MSSRVTMQQPAAQAAQARRQQLTAALPAACSQQQQLPAACAARQARPQRRSGPAAAPAPVAAAAAVAALLPAAPAAAAAWAQPLADLAEAMDEAPVWTLDQAVGLVFAGLLLALYLGSTQVDRFVARDQRRQLGLCEECGGLNDPATCSQRGCPMRQP